MPTMSAILRIDARTSGQQGLKELDGLVRRIGPGAEGSVGGVSRLSGALGRMGTIAGGIGLASLGSQMIAFGGDAVQAADDTLLVERRMNTLAGQMGETGRLTGFARDSADRFTLSQLDASQAVADLYGRLRPMGISLSDIQSTFNGVNTTARNAGLSMLDAKEAFRQLGQAMGSGRLQGDEFRAIMERMPQIGTAIVKVFNDIARDKGLVQITRDRANEMVSEVKEGEKKQTSMMKEQAKEREQAAEQETEALIREINKRYDAMRRALDRQYEDNERARGADRDRAADNLEQSLDKESEARIQAIEDRYREEKKQRERAREDEESDPSYQQMLENMSDQQRTELERRRQDEAEAIEKRIDDQQKAETDAIKESFDNKKQAALSEAKEKQIIEDRAIADQKRAQEEAIQDRQRTEEASARESLDKQKQNIQTGLNTQIEETKKANEKIIAGILERVKVTQGDLKKMASEGLITPDILVKAMKELEKAKLVDATPLQKFNVAMADLSREVGDNLLPLLTPLIEGLAGLVRGFGNMPEPLQAVAIGLGAVGLGIGAIKVTAQTLGGLGLLIKSLRDVATAGKAAQAAQAVGDVASLGRTSVNPFQVKPLANTLKPPPPGMFAGFLKEVGTVAKAFGGLTLEAGKFFLKLAVEIPGVARLGSVFAGLRIGATIAGWAGAIGPFVGTFMAAMGGIMTFMTGTVLPTLVGIFSGPVGWIAMAAIALGTAIYIWREPIGKFFAWIWESIPKWVKTIFETWYGVFINPWVTLWEKVLKGPVTGFFSWIGNALKPIGNLFVNIGTAISEAVKTWFKFVNEIFIQPVIKYITDGLKGLVIIGYTIFVQPWIRLWDAVKKPAADLFNYLGTAAGVAFDKIIRFAYDVWIQPWVTLWDAIKKPAADLWKWLQSEETEKAFQYLIDTGYDLFIEPWVELWDKIKKPISDLYGWIQSGIEKTFKFINKHANEKFITPWQNVWKTITEEPDTFQSKVKGWFSDLYEFILKKWEAIPALFQEIWGDVTDGMGRVWQRMVNGAFNALNGLIRLWNGVADKVNALPGPLKLPIILEMTAPTPVGFARGGFVDRPTLGWIGEGPNPREYAIPEGSMDAAAAGWQAGLRGGRLVKAFQNGGGGLTPGSSLMGGGGGGGGSGGVPGPVNITISGGVTQLPDGRQMVSLEQVQAIAMAYSRQAMGATVRLLGGR